MTVSIVEIHIRNFEFLKDRKLGEWVFMHVLNTSEYAHIKLVTAPSGNTEYNKFADVFANNQQPIKTVSTVSNC